MRICHNQRKILTQSHAVNQCNKWKAKLKGELKHLLTQTSSMYYLEPNVLPAFQRAKDTPPTALLQSFLELSFTDGGVKQCLQ